MVNPIQRTIKLRALWGAILGTLTGLAVFIPSFINVIPHLGSPYQDPFANIFAGIGVYLVVMGLIGFTGWFLLDTKPRLARYLLVGSGVGGLLLGLLIPLIGFVFWGIPGFLLINAGLTFR